VGDFLFKLLPGKTFFFKVPDKSKFSEQKTRIDAGIVELLGEVRGSGGLASTRPFTSDYNGVVGLIHGGIIQQGLGNWG